MKADTPVNPYWQSFSVAKSSCTKVATGWLVNNMTTARLARSSTHRQCVEAICTSALRPVPMVSVCEELSANLIGSRGKIFFGAVGDQIDGILANYADVSWWVVEQGLHIGVVEPGSGADEAERESRVARLKPFDKYAGPLAAAKWDDKLAKAHMRLSDDALEEITAKLDSSGVSFKEMLSPKWRARLTAYNQKHNHRAIKSFAAAIKSHDFERLIRRRIYCARKRYLEAIQAPSRSPNPEAVQNTFPTSARTIPECFWSIPSS